MKWEYYEMKKEIKKSWNFSGIHYINMIDINRKTYERNDLEIIVDNDRILCNIQIMENIDMSQ